jgi:hypothetical protein
MKRHDDSMLESFFKTAHAKADIARAFTVRRNRYSSTELAAEFGIQGRGIIYI